MKNNSLYFRLISPFILLLLLSTSAYSQYVLGGFVGASDYSGDLANTPLDMKHMDGGAGIFAGYYLDDYFQVRGRFTWQKISAEDQNQPSTARRNLSFESHILELSTLISFELDEFERFDYRLKPFAYTGFGVFKHNPKAEINGELVELQPLGTEGQGIPGYGTPYRLTDLVVPFGGGVKYKFGDHIIMELSVDAKKVFTDYLDDVSGQEYVPPSVIAQRGPTAYAAAYRKHEIGGRPFSDYDDPAVRAADPRNLSRLDDWYYFFGISGSYYLKTKGKSKIPKNRKGVPNKY